jgi:hypothetical protein
MSGCGDSLLYNIGGAEENHKHPSLGRDVSTPRYDPYTFCQDTEDFGQLCVIIRESKATKMVRILSTSAAWTGSAARASGDL